MKSLSPKKVLRIAHLTDIHITWNRKAEQKFYSCLEQLAALKEQPDLVINGGDTVMDSLEEDETSVKRQWKLWKKLEKDIHYPLYHCIGNHDVWGWGKKSGCSGKELLYGKKMAMEQLEISKRYYSFDKAGWHIIILDSTHTRKGYLYTAKLDEEQFEWLQEELNKLPKATPILVVSHAPILCGCAFMDGDNERTGEWTIPGAWVHIDARRIKDLFYQHPNVRLALSGHMHLVDRLDYNGVTYLCNGAVCGAWWKGSYQETPPGFAVIDLYNDGSFQHKYLPTYWGKPMGRILE